MDKKITIGNSQGFWGDSPTASIRLVTGRPDLNVLTLDYLSELSLSIMAIQKEKDSSMGYARDFIDVVRSLAPLWNGGNNTKIVTNAGGLNPIGCGKAVVELLHEIGRPEFKVGVVLGDDVLDTMLEDPTNPDYNNAETGAPLTTIQEKLVSVNAYFGAASIAEALQSGAHIVVTGRIADPSLVVGPCLDFFGWDMTDYDKIASATIAGHLIECGVQVTGGIWSNWTDILNPALIGYPVVEIEENGTFIITKPEGTDGVVNIQTVKEQLLYEIGDPGNYLTPDAVVSLLGLSLQQEAKNRVKVEGALGFPPTDKYKVSATYRHGYKVEGMLGIFGRHAPIKGSECGKAILEKVRKAGYELQETNIECIGSGDVVPGVFAPRTDLLECMLRVTAMDPNKEALEYLSKEIAPMVTSGPQGVTGYTTGRPKVRPVFGYWPCYISKEKTQPKWEILNG